MREVTACGGLSTAPLDGLQTAARRRSSVASAAGPQVSPRMPDLPHVMRRQHCQQPFVARSERGCLAPLIVAGASFVGSGWGRCLCLFRFWETRHGRRVSADFGKTPSDGHVLWGAQVYRQETGREKREVLEGLALPEPLRITS